MFLFNVKDINLSEKVSNLLLSYIFVYKNTVQEDHVAFYIVSFPYDSYRCTDLYKGIYRKMNIKMVKLSSLNH